MMAIRKPRCGEGIDHRGHWPVSVREHVALATGGGDLSDCLVLQLRRNNQAIQGNPRIGDLQERFIVHVDCGDHGAQTLPVLLLNSSDAKSEALSRRASTTKSRR